MNLKSFELDAFIEKSDALGGPDHPDTHAYWSGFRYIPSVTVDTNLDPDSHEYFSQMMNLYEELSGRLIDQKITELTMLNVDELVDLESPLAFQKPSQKAIHYLRLAKAIQIADLPKSAHFLDMGCGWGFSSELLAQMGFNVLAIDINPLFVELVQRRAKRLNLNINVMESSFDDCVIGPTSFDAVLFNECFHHAVYPNNLLRNIYSFLKPSGKLILTGEPIQDLWWPNWGLRLDAISVYCARKFGWFESGWSELYLKRKLAENNFIPIFFDSPDPSIGKFVIAAKSWMIGMKELVSCALPNEWFIENSFLVSNRQGHSSTLMLTRPKDAEKIVFEIWNFCPIPLDIVIKFDFLEKPVTLNCGGNQISLNCKDIGLLALCNFVCPSWTPSELLGTNDERKLGFHLKQILFDVEN